MGWLRVAVSLWFVGLLSAMIIRGLIVGRFDGPWLVVGPLAGMGLSVLLGLSIGKIGSAGIEFQRREGRNDDTIS